MDKPIIILGAGIFGKSAMDLFVNNGVLIYGFLDDDTTLHSKEIGEVKVLGAFDDQSYLAITGDECNAFIAVEEIELRRNLAQMLLDKRQVIPVNAIHNAAVLAASIQLGFGNYIGAGSIIGSYSILESHIIIHPGAVISHEVKLASFVQVGSGSIINAGVQIEEDVFIGSGVTIVAGTKIGRGARIGAGSVVINNIKAGDTVFGNPANPV